MDSLSNNLLRSLSNGAIRPAVNTPRSKDQASEQDSRRSPRAALNLIPSPDMLTSLIAQARQALAKGIFWDRGSIINIVL